MPVHYIETGSVSPCFNLAFEEYILENKREGDWLMLWQNDRTVVIGLNQNAFEEVNRDYAEASGITVVRRRTGGGAVYHDLGNLNYSFITDIGDRESFTIERFSRPVCRALESLGLHAETGGRNDILIDGRKISGVAQRLSKDRVLHHGTLLFSSDLSAVSAVLNPDPDKFISKSSKSVRSRVANISEFLPEDISLAEFKARILVELTRDGIIHEELTPAELEAVNSISRDRYSSSDWTYGKCPDYTYRNKKRFEGGTLVVEANVSRGVIKEIHIGGDFMASSDITPLTVALTGLKADRAAIAAALDGIDLGSVTGGITKENILDLMP